MDPVQVILVGGFLGSVQHQQDHGLVAPELQILQEPRNVLRLHRPRYPLDRAYAQNTSDWLLAAGSTHEGAMAGGKLVLSPNQTGSTSGFGQLCSVPKG
jgi:hypothetical protein